jgi:hypothetical protein
MNRLSSTELVRLRELLADEILGQLDTGEVAELQALRARANAEELPEIDQTMGELLLAIDGLSSETMPAQAKQRLLSARPDHAAPAPGPVATIRPAMNPLGKLGWAAAIAASLTAAVVWINRPTPTPVQPDPSPIALVTRDPGTVAIDIAPQGTLAEATQQTSEVLWNQQALVVETEQEEALWQRFLEKPAPQDPWRNPWGYRAESEFGLRYDLWSNGPDGEEGTDDDITNWTAEDEAGGFSAPSGG